MASGDIHPLASPLTIASADRFAGSPPEADVKHDPSILAQPKENIHRIPTEKAKKEPAGKHRTLTEAVAV